MPPSPTLTVDGLVKVYPPAVRAVDGVSFEVGPGEVFALLGPNGAGKTTTIRTIVTLVRPTAGRVAVAGKDVLAEPDAARVLTGYVPQEVALDRYLTGRQHLELACRLYRVPRRALTARVDELLRLVDLAARADELVKRYSGGMKRRLDVACGLVHEPRLLVLDEPTLGLDLQTRLRLWAFVRELRARGTAVLLTTHDLAEADALSDRVAIVDHGRVQATGTPAELKASYGGEVVRVELGQAAPGEAALKPEHLAALRALDGVQSVLEHGQAVQLVTPRARDLAPRVADALDRAGLAVRMLSFGPPSLGDVFLKVTGHAIRDEAA